MMEHLIYLLAFRIVVCRECRYAVLPSHIDSHFATKPYKLSKKERQKIEEEVSEIDGLIGNEETLRRSNFTFPPPMSMPITALGKPEENALQCRDCQHICCTIRGMQAHQRDEHRWKSKQRKGRPKRRARSRDDEAPWRTGVHCQQFFIQEHKSG